MKQPAKKSAKVKPASKPKPKPKPKPKVEKPIEPKWGKPEKLQNIPRTYLEGTLPPPSFSNSGAKPKTLSNEEFLDMVKTRTLIKNGTLKTMTTEEYMEMGRKLVQSEANEKARHRAEKISIYAIIAFVMMFLFWCWTYSDSKNEIKNMEVAQQQYQLQVDSLNQVIGDLQANLQIQLDTIHNDSSKIPQ